MHVKGYDFGIQAVWTFEPEGGSPVVITVPHDCGYSFCDLDGLFEKRVAGFLGRDSHVWPIVKDVMLGVKVNVVRAMIPRHFIDFNRPMLDSDPDPSASNECAIEDRQWDFAYTAYHQKIRQFIRKANEKSCRVLLIDMHGFAKQPKDREYDLILAVGDKSAIGGVHANFARFMRGKGYRVFSPNIHDYKKGYNYDGGHTCKFYAQGLEIDTIQIEIASHFRAKGCEVLGKRLASDLAEFIKKFCQ